MGCCKSAKAQNAVSADAARMALVYAALSNPVRLEILAHVARHRHCGCKDITDVLPLAQSTVSQHLKVLCEADLILMEAVPPRSRYSVNEVLLQDVSRSTTHFLNACCGADCDPLP